MSRTRLSAAVGIVGAVALTLSACGSSSGSGGSSDGEIVVGLIANKTGPNAGGYGIPFSNGTAMALDAIAESGYLKDAGLSFKVVEEDGASEVSAAVTAYNKVTREGAIVVLDDTPTPIAAAISPIANQDKVLFIIGAGSKVDNKEGFTFLTADLVTPYLTLGTYLHEEGKKRVVAIVDGDNPAFPSMAKTTEQGLVEAGGSTFIATESVSATDTDFSTVLTKVAAMKPDAVQIAAQGEQAGNILLQMQRSGDFEGVLPVGIVGWNPQTAAIAKDAATGAVFTVPWAPGAEGSGTFAEDYEKEFGDAPSPYAALGYHTVWTLAVAAKQLEADGEDVTAETLRDALPSTSTSDEMAKHGLIPGFTLKEDGMSSYPGVLSTFASDGNTTALTE